ncbi:hypothetical protein RFI_19103 [Reticulomyxa filosa]|uniref:Uncharacterized protein n=1 Tax=Reticulomyxa filosa TaxID=46433 RepID=X6MX11_RETFI|nr:hypothetical protein RFI_19103 [Reticulomyxa filosa]|eukprot:ETO18176.1 hypothetical protein RFI_19103 [Reticulomyxa filosa]
MKDIFRTKEKKSKAQSLKKQKNEININKMRYKAAFDGFCSILQKHVLYSAQMNLTIARNELVKKEIKLIVNDWPRTSDVKPGHVNDLTKFTQLYVLRDFPDDTHIIVHLSKQFEYTLRQKRKLCFSMKKQHLIKIFLKISNNRVVFKYHFGFLLSLYKFFKNFILSFDLVKFLKKS